MPCGVGNNLTLNDTEYCSATYFCAITWQIKTLSVKVCGVCVRTLKPQGFCGFLCEIRLTQRRKGREALCTFVLLSKSCTQKARNDTEFCSAGSFWQKNIRTYFSHTKSRTVMFFCSYVKNHCTQELTELQGALLSHHADWNTNIVSKILWILCFLCEKNIFFCLKYVYLCEVFYWR